MSKQLRATVTGRVQAVGFRDFVRREATARGLLGYVRNSDDGSMVEIVAEGDERALLELLLALRDGPRFARVDRVDESLVDATDAFGDFRIEF